MKTDAASSSQTPITDCQQTRRHSPDRSCIISAVKTLKSRNKDVTIQRILLECHLSLWSNIGSIC